jgi:hypothetical protein
MGELVASGHWQCAPPPVSCTTGTVTIRASSIVGAAGNAGTKPGAGLSVGRALAGTDTCTGTISGVEVRGFRSGIEVLTGSPTPVALTDVTLRDNGVSAAGAGLQIAAGKVNATRLTINKTGTGTAAAGVLLEPAANVSPPAFTATELTVADVGQAGVELRTGAGSSVPTATLTNGDLKTADVGIRVAVGTLTATGTRVHNNGGDGVTVTAGTATLHKVNLVDNDGRGLNVAGGTVTIDDGSTVTSNGTNAAPSDGIGILGGTVTIGGGSGQRVDIGASTGAGIKVTAPAATTVSISRALVHNSAKAGLDLDVAVDGGKITVTDCDVHDNTGEGVRLVRGPATTGAAVSLDNVRVYLNNVGVALRADTGDLVASVKNCAIHDNRDTGLLVQQGTGNVTSATIEGNDVLHNNSAAGRSVGGVFFATPSTLVSFAGNKVHGNPGDEMGFDAKPNGGDTWDLSGPMDCTAPNVLSCYNLAVGGTAVGLRILPTAPAGTKVNAASVSWANAVPAKGVDFEFTDVTDVVTAVPACTPATNSCP